MNDEEKKPVKERYMREVVGNKIKSIILRTEQTRITQLTIQKKKSQFKIMVAVCKLTAHAHLVIRLHANNLLRKYGNKYQTLF